jgi:hypothetical protein
MTKQPCRGKSSFQDIPHDDSLSRVLVRATLCACLVLCFSQAVPFERHCNWVHLTRATVQSNENCAICADEERFCNDRMNYLRVL